MKTETKICTCCKIEFPKTLEFFLLKPKKPESYKWIVHEIYRSYCKKCHYKKTTENQIKKRCKVLGIEIKEYENYKRTELLKRPIFQLKDENLKDLKRSIRARILRKIRKENYVFTTYENYKKDCSINKSKSQRKYNYKEGSGLITLDIVKKELPDYYIAQKLKMKVNEIPKEIIETKRIIIQLKRELKNGN